MWFGTLLGKAFNFTFIQTEYIKEGINLQGSHGDCWMIKTWLAAAVGSNRSKGSKNKNAIGAQPIEPRSESGRYRTLQLTMSAVGLQSLSAGVS